MTFCVDIWSVIFRYIDRDIYLPAPIAFVSRDSMIAYFNGQDYFQKLDDDSRHIKKIINRPAYRYNIMYRKFLNSRGPCRYFCRLLFKLDQRNKYEFICSFDDMLFNVGLQIEHLISLAKILKSGDRDETHKTLEAAIHLNRLVNDMKKIHNIVLDNRQIRNIIRYANEMSCEHVFIEHFIGSRSVYNIDLRGNKIVGINAILKKYPKTKMINDLLIRTDEIPIIYGNIEKINPEVIEFIEKKFNWSKERNRRRVFDINLYLCIIISVMAILLLSPLVILVLVLLSPAIIVFLMTGRNIPAAVVAQVMSAVTAGIIIGFILLFKPI